MIVFMFDGSFEGFLTSIFESYYAIKKPNMLIRSEDYDKYYNLIDEFITIATDMSKSDKVFKALKEKFTKEAFAKIYYSYLSSEENVYTTLYHFIVLGFKLGKTIDMHLNNDIVREVNTISRKVTLEKHRFLGFVRFKKLTEDFYYSSIEPDNNILPLIAPHFVNRFKEQNFIIHDLSRNIAIFYDKKQWVIRDFNIAQSKGLLTYSEVDNYDLLWKNYYSNLSIEERENSKLQKRMMPARYWSHLTELQ